MKKLKGYKTIAGSIVIGLVVIASSLNLIDEQVAQIMLGAVVTFTGVSMRLAIKRP